MIVDPSLKSVRIIIVFNRGEIVLFPIEIRGQSPRHLDGIIAKLHIDLIQRCRVPLDRLINWNPCGQIVEENPSLVPPGLNSSSEYEIRVVKPTK